MKILRNITRCGIAAAASCMMASAVEVADISKIAFDEIPSPDIQTSKSKTFRPKDWLELEAGLKIPAQNQLQLDSGFIDRVMVKWYVAIEEKASGRPVLLTADVNHVNVPVGEEVFSAVYLSPNTLKRLTGSDRGSKSKVKAVAIEVFVDGVKVGQEGEGQSIKNPPWWMSPSLARGDRFPLANKNQTPFKMLWWDRYAEIEEERR